MVGALVLITGLAWGLNVFGIRGAAPIGSVAVLFDSPPPYPGYAWTHDGQRVGEFELVTIAGPGHCNWESATFMFIAWPPSSASRDASQSRQYIRDPGASSGKASTGSFSISTHGSRKTRDRPGIAWQE